MVRAVSLRGKVKNDPKIPESSALVIACGKYITF